MMCDPRFSFVVFISTWSLVYCFFFFLNILYFHVINYSFHLVFSFYEFHYLLLKSNFLSNLSKKFSLIFILKFIFSIAKELGSWSLTLSLTLCFCRVSWDLDYNHLSIYLSIYIYIYIHILYVFYPNWVDLHILFICICIHHDL